MEIKLTLTEIERMKLISEKQLTKVNPNGPSCREAKIEVYQGKNALFELDREEGEYRYQENSSGWSRWFKLVS